MSAPKPPVELTGHCSVIHENKLYVYTPTAFLSLPLKEGAKWSPLKRGVSTTGAACFKGGVDGNADDPAFYVVGGKSDEDDYSGVQRYSFSGEEWTTIHPTTQDMKNRTHHAAIYLIESSSILIFAGSQNDDPNPSTQTFLMSAAPPYNIRSDDSNVPPTIDPILLPWNTDKAVMVGGGPDNTDVFTFSAGDRWKDAGTSLVEPLGALSGVKCALVSGADGSKVLEIFDMTVSPNEVRRYALALPDGSPAPPGQEVGASSSKNPKYLRYKRDVTLDNYPAFDDTFVPKSTRDGFSLAQDSNDFVVISGGDSENPVIVFDQAKNKWKDTSDIFGDSALKLSLSSSQTATSTSTTSRGSTTTTSSVSTSSTSSMEATITSSTLPASSSTAPGSDSSAIPTSTSTDAAEGGSSNNQTLTIIGATLGAVLGFAALLIIILLLLGWKKRRNNRNKAGESRGVGDKDRLSFQDQGMEPLTRAVQPMGRGAVPSADSWIIVSDQAEGKLKPPPAAYAGSSEKGRSPLSKEVMTQGDSHSTNNILTPGQPTADDKERGGRLTDEGWSKYFQGDNETMGGRTNSLRSSLSSEGSKSDYRNSVWPHSSAEVPPLNLGRLEQTGPLGKVSSGSPSAEHPPPWDSTLAAQQGMSAKILNGDTNSMSSDDYDMNKQSAQQAPGRFPFQHDGPDTASKSYIFKEPRVPSSNYSNSVYQPANDFNSLAPPGKFTERPVTQWPSDAVAGNSEESPNRAVISSDVSWLNLGNKK